MRFSRKSKIIFILIFTLSVSLRLALVAFNREANDAHEAVASLIIQLDRLPQKDDCWECFQPKLFHYVFAKMLQTVGMENNPGYQQNIVGNFINFLAGIACLVVVWIFIKGSPIFNERIKLFAFALVSLNPSLLGINSQATNDTFAILFSTLALFFAHKFISGQKKFALILSLTFLLLGISSKTNVWVTAIAIFAALFIKTLVVREYRKKHASIAVIFLSATIFFSVLNPLNQYIVNYLKFGSPILLNIDRDPLPHFSGEYSNSASGVWYIQDGFFTFKLIELLKHPRLDPNTPEYLPHQTSFWTVLYARAHSIHFDNAPPAWSTTGTTLFTLSRAIFILALLPTLLILFGGIRDTLWIGKSIIKKDVPLAHLTYYGLFAATMVGFFLFQTLYSLLYRSLTVIKAIFILPALLSFTYFFLQAVSSFYSVLSNRKQWLIYCFEASISALLILYVVDIVTLISALVQVYIEKQF